MGTFYSFEQADNEKEAQDMIDWLTKEGLLPIPDFKPGRTPTYAEIRRVLDQMDSYKIDYSVSPKSWDIDIEAPDGSWSWLFGYEWENLPLQDENVPANVAWKGYLEAVQPIAQKLANICGTITITNDSDPNDLVFVYPDSTPENNPAHK